MPPQPTSATSIRMKPTRARRVMNLAVRFANSPANPAFATVMLIITPPCRKHGTRASWRRPSTDRSPDPPSGRSFPPAWDRSAAGFSRSSHSRCLRHAGNSDRLRSSPLLQSQQGITIAAGTKPVETALQQAGSPQLHRVRHPQHRVWGCDRTLEASNFRLPKVGNFRLPLTPAPETSPSPCPTRPFSTCVKPSAKLFLGDLQIPVQFHADAGNRPLGVVVQDAAGGAAEERNRRVVAIAERLGRLRRIGLHEAGVTVGNGWRGQNRQGTCGRAGET